MKKKLLILLGLLVFIFVVLAFVFGRGPNAHKVTTEPLAFRDIVERVSASGKIQPEVEVKITAEVNGQIIALPVKEGDVVKQGDLLVQLNADIYEAALLRAEAALNSAKSNLASSRAQVAQADANRYAAEQAFNRSKTLFDQRVISQAEFDQAEANFRTANANLTSAEESVRSAEFAIRSGKATLQEAQDNLARTTLRAPQSGVVTALSKEIGESVQGTGFTAGEVIMNISDLSLMEVNVEVNETDIVRIQIGDLAEVEVDAYLGETFQGTVSEIGNTALNAGMNGFNMDQVTNFSVKIRLSPESYQHLMEGLDATSTPFRPGMSATVDILTDREEGVLAAPIQAVTSRRAGFEHGGQSEAIPGSQSEAELGVFVMADGTAHWKKVETGIQDSWYVSIEGDITEDDVVITGPFDLISRTLNHGDAVSTE